jgi:hypothetical protein
MNLENASIGRFIRGAEEAGRMEGMVNWEANI